METLVYFSAPGEPGKMSFFVEFSGEKLIEYIRSFGYEKNVVYFHDKETFDDIIEDLQEMAQLYKGEIRVGKGKYLSGLRTVAAISFKIRAVVFEVEYDFGYERDELEIMESLSIGENARQSRRKEMIEQWGGFISKGEKIDLAGVSFRYLP